MQAKKHSEMIKAWADGYEIEAFNPERQTWVSTPEPGWFDDIEYRVKPRTIRAPRVVKRYAQIEVNPFSDELELTEPNLGMDSVGALNVVMTFENDTLVDIDMVETTFNEDSDEEPLPW